MATTSSGTKKKAWPAIVLVVATLLLAVFVIRELDRTPRTDDAYVYADTIDVVPEVSGRIVELAVRDNQAVKQGDLLFRIDPRPYQDALTRGQASLVALDRQIELTQRTVNAQQYNAQSVRAAVERARAAAGQACRYAASHGAAVVARLCVGGGRRPCAHRTTRHAGRTQRRATAGAAGGSGGERRRCAGRATCRRHGGDRDCRTEPRVCDGASTVRRPHCFAEDIDGPVCDRRSNPSSR